MIKTVCTTTKVRLRILCRLIKGLEKTSNLKFTTVIKIIFINIYRVIISFKGVSRLE